MTELKGDPKQDIMEARVQLVALDWFRNLALDSAEEILKLLANIESQDVVDLIQTLAEERDEAQEFAEDERDARVVAETRLAMYEEDDEDPEYKPFPWK